MPIAIIALTSARGQSGKDTLIEELTKVGHKIHRVAFGDVLKDRCADVMAGEVFSKEDLLGFFHSKDKDHPMPGLRINELPESEYAKWLHSNGLNNDADRTPRWHLQMFGTDFSRNHLGDPDVWLREGLKEIEKAPADHIAVVTDLRQINEYVALASLSSPECHVRMVRMQRMWFNEAIDTADYHVSDLDLIGTFMHAVVLNKWGEQASMITQLKRQGVIA